MGTVYAIDREGELHALPARRGTNLMEILRDANLPVEAICGGQCICSTCHIYVDVAWAARLKPRGEAEQVMVEDTGHFQPTSRLACQVDYEDSLDGLQLALAPEY